MDKKVALEVLSDVSQYLEGYQFFLDAGTLLGIYRNGDFIDHDTDLDFAIIINPSKNPEFPTPDWPLIAVWNYRNLPMQRAYLYKGIVVDFYFYYTNLEEGLIVNHNDHGVLKLKLVDSLPLSSYEFKNHNVNFPQSVENVLQSEYGEEWRTPKRSKDDWGDDRFNLFREFPLWPINLDGHIPNEAFLKKHSKLNADLEVSLLKIDQLTQQRDELTQQRDERTQQRDELTQQRDELTQQRDERTQQRDELTQQRDELTQQRDVILNSTIWRATRPIRWFVNQFKR